MSSKIVIKDLFDSTSLVTREPARQLFTCISGLSDNSIVLDFSEIQYASRSFFSEWNSFQSKLSLLGKQVEIINLDDNLSMLNEIVIKAIASKSRMVYSSLASAKYLTI